MPELRRCCPSLKLCRNERLIEDTVATMSASPNVAAVKPPPSVVSAAVMERRRGGRRRHRHPWKLKNLPLPEGYYGNAFMFLMAVGAAGEVRVMGLEYAAEKVRRAKGEVTEEYVRSVADMMVERGRP
ncbi:hypothetical protein Syun_017103 [Stephania yunnanensis]|uniref:Uncharacterized protein n=1 Tax=Stephania yunnanensis TaxID=152371 RepID=A0AAP0P5I5_9MAGN